MQTISLQQYKVPKELFDELLRVSSEHNTHRTFSQMNVFIEEDDIYIQRRFSLNDHIGPLDKFLSQLNENAAGLIDPKVDEVYSWEIDYGSSSDCANLYLIGYVKVTDPVFKQLIQEAIAGSEQYDLRLKQQREEQIREQARKLGMKD